MTILQTIIDKVYWLPRRLLGYEVFHYLPKDMMRAGSWVTDLFYDTNLFIARIIEPIAQHIKDGIRT
jgi:hypothetical protein